MTETARCLRGRLLCLVAIVVMSQPVITVLAQTMKSPPFKLKISAKQQVKSGRDIFVNIAQINISDGPVDCSSHVEDGANITFLYDIHDAAGHPIAPRDMSLPYPGSFQGCTLPSGQTAQSDYLLTSMYPELERPGKYTIQVSRRISGDMKDTVKSNVVTIEVVP